jgi:saccharopine dehydrogenase-like NADP-dependent oxidoreductase
LCDGKTIPVFTDCGLAPGLINIVTERMLKGYSPEKVNLIECMVGGIPTKAIDPPFNYHCTWNIDGLWNEYFDDIQMLWGGEVDTRPGLSNVTEEFCAGLDFLRLESFRTSGAAAHSIESLQSRGFKNFQYKTLRYPHHADFIRSLGYGCKGIVKRLSDTAPCKDDMVIGIVKIYTTNSIERQEFVIREDMFSAMQIATAAPTAVIAGMILDGHLPSRYLKYEDMVPHYFYFTQMLEKLGVDID